MEGTSLKRLRWLHATEPILNLKLNFMGAKFLLQTTHFIFFPCKAFHYRYAGLSVSAILTNCVHQMYSRDENQI